MFDILMGKQPKSEVGEVYIIQSELAGDLYAYLLTLLPKSGGLSLGRSASETDKLVRKLQKELQTGRTAAYIAAHPIVPCENCGGTGVEPECSDNPGDTCDACGGDGEGRELYLRVGDVQRFYDFAVASGGFGGHYINPTNIWPKIEYRMYKA